LERKYWHQCSTITKGAKATILATKVVPITPDEPLGAEQLHCQFCEANSPSCSPSGHPVQSTEICNESYLNNNISAFPTVDPDNEKLDGCYVTLDIVRGDLIHSGFAEQGQGRRWKEHLRASHLTHRNARDGSQYQFYPHESVGDDVLHV
jgi:hypothetical protein